MRFVYDLLGFVCTYLCLFLVWVGSLFALGLEKFIKINSGYKFFC